MPIAFADISRLGIFEIIESPEDWQPTVALGRGEAGQVRRVNHQHRVTFESDRTWLNISHAGQQQGCEHFAITQAATNPGRNFFQQPVSRRLFEQADNRLDRRIESNDAIRPLAASGER